MKTILFVIRSNISVLSFVILSNYKRYWGRNSYLGCYYTNTLFLLTISFMLYSCQTIILPNEREEPASTTAQGSNEAHAIPIEKERPSSRAFHQMTYDSTRKLIVMFGGQSNSFLDPVDKIPRTIYLNDTWEFNGDVWQKVISLINPDIAEGYGMTFDVNRNIIVLIGGSQEIESGDRFARIWEFDGVEWTLLALNSEIPAQSFPLLAFDSNQQDIILFSGFQLSDIWRYDGQTWTLLPSQVPPLMRGSPIAKVVYFEPADAFIFTNLEGETKRFIPFHENDWISFPLRDEGDSGRFGFDMVYDSNRGVIVLFGGQRQLHSVEVAQVESTETLSDTWEFNGEVWYRVSPIQEPPARYAHAMAYDEMRDVVVLFGGIGIYGQMLNDTWEYDGVTWTQK